MPTIYIDCSSTYQSAIQTGIQRVVRNVVRHADQIATRHGYRIKVVALNEGDFSEIPILQVLTPKPMAGWRQRASRSVILAVLSVVDKARQALASLSPASGWQNFVHAPRYRFGLAWCLCLPLSTVFSFARKLQPKAIAGSPRSAHLSPPGLDHGGDILLLADSTWDFTDIWPAAERFRAQGGYVATVIYDLIPLSHPQYCVSSLVNAYTNWIKSSISCVDFYICISHSTQIALDAFLASYSHHNDQASRPKTGFFHLGSDLDLAQLEGEPNKKATSIVAAGDPVFLAVGSLEPRKNLAFVLDAFDQVWQRNKRVRLVLVGHNTWKVDELIARIHHHPLRNANLFWLRDASDTDLEYLYQNGTALIFASKVEGFGLPVVEAMQRGLPVVCGDLPVLRELADGKVRFFNLDSTDELGTAVQEMAAIVEKTGSLPRIVHPWLSWRNSCENLLGSVIRQHQESMAGSLVAASLARS